MLEWWPRKAPGHLAGKHPRSWGLQLLGAPRQGRYQPRDHCHEKQEASDTFFSGSSILYRSFSPLTMPDHRAEPVSSNVPHARTPAIDATASARPGIPPRREERT